MPRDRRRGRRPRHPHGPVKAVPSGQQQAQAVLASKQVFTDKACHLAKASPKVRQPGLVNPHLGKDLRSIGVVAVALLVLLIVLSLVI